MSACGWVKKGWKDTWVITRCSYPFLAPSLLPALPPILNTGPVLRWEKMRRWAHILP